MEFAFSPFVVPLILAGLVSLAMAYYAWLRRGTQSALALMMLGLLLAEWSLGYALELASVNLADKFFWGKLQYIGIAGVPLFWVIFAYNHANPGKRLSHLAMGVLAIIPAMTIGLALTMEQHSLIWGPVDILDLGYVSSLRVLSRGFWFTVHFAYSYLLLLAGTIIIALWLRKMRGLYRRQAAAIIFAIIAPWAGNMLYFMGVNPDPTPFAFTITLAALLWAIFGYRLVDVAPLARDVIVEGMRDGMIALDMNARVADMNPAAARIIGLPASEVIGKPLADALAPWPHLIERFETVAEGEAEISVGQGQAVRHYLVRIARLSDENGHPIGRLINLRERDTSVPPPRFAKHEPRTQPLTENVLSQSPRAEMPRTKPNPVLHWLKQFFLPPVLGKAYMPDDLNPSWAQTIEQAVTVSARFIMVFGTLSAWSILSNLEIAENIVYATAIVTFLAVSYFVALARTAPFHFRVGTFLFLVYVIAVTELLKYGFTSNIFLYFIVLIILAHMLLNLRGGFWMLGLAVVTLSIFSWFVVSGRFEPTEAAQTIGIILPRDSDSAITSIVVYLFSSLTMMTVVNMFILNLNQAWKKETQALNLLQQERDLLEQRVIERTSDLSEARDLAVQRSNELRKYFRAIEQSGSSIVITDPQGAIEYVNPNFEQETGYSLAEVLGKNFHFLKSGEQPAALYTELWQTISAGHVWSGELHSKRKDASTFWEAVTIAPVLSSENEITNYVAIKEDITAQKELRETLARQNEYLATLQNITLELLDRRDRQELLDNILQRARGTLNASLGAIALWEDGQLVFRAVAADRHQLYGQTVSRENMPLVWKAFEQRQTVVIEDYVKEYGTYQARAGQTLHAVADFPIISGSQVLGVIALGRSESALPFSDSQIEFGQSLAQIAALVLDNANLYDAALRELEERKRAESLLRESEVRFRQIVENASDIIYRADNEGNFTYVNPTALNLMGFKSESEVLGRNYLELARPEWRAKLKRFYVRQFLRGEQNSYFEFEALTNDGRAIWIGQSVQIIRDAEKVIGFQAVARDITKLKQAQEALALARDQAMEASRFKSQLLAKISHELRTPLGSIIGYAELLQGRAFGELNEEQRDATNNIVDSANYLNTMINELLDQAQIEARSLKLHILPFSPAEMLAQVAVTMSILAQRKNLAFSHTIEAGFPENLLGDAKRLQQILINLTGNAIKFTTKGSVKVELFRPDPTHWAMRVSDTGAGIPKDAQAYIFEPFRQVDNAITHYNRGTGLGLSITKQLVELMGGQIDLQSEVDQGSVFTVTLPIQVE
jgi:PAS domain S-box-containing protein